ncbi:nitroreductase family protein [bacterium]|nr:nitroreductase family protein [bacterium]
MLLDLIKDRYSLRNFDSQMPEFDDIKYILEAGRLAPSFLNLQPWHFIVIKDENTKNFLYNLSGGQPHVLKAPVIIACCADLSVFDYENYRENLSKRAGMTQEKLQYFLSSKALNPASHSQEAVKFRALEEVTYAISYMTLAAHERGLETCIIGGIGNEYTQILQDVYAVTKMELELPKNVYLAALLLVGYPTEDNIVQHKDRKPFEEVVSFEKYSLTK